MGSKYEFKIVSFNRETGHVKATLWSVNPGTFEWQGSEENVESLEGTLKGDKLNFSAGSVYQTLNFKIDPVEKSLVSPHILIQIK